MFIYTTFELYIWQVFKKLRFIASKKGINTLKKNELLKNMTGIRE